jgi:hypothetical protein
MLEINDSYWKLDGKDMPIVTQSAHIGIQKSETNSTPSPELLSMSSSGFTYTL